MMRYLPCANAFPVDNRLHQRDESYEVVYEAPSMSVKRACDWSVTAPRRAVRFSEASMGLVNGRDALPSRSRNSCPALQ